MSSKFGQIRPLVSMATDSVIIRKTVLPLFLDCFDGIHLILTGNDDIHKSLNVFKKFGQIRPRTTELAALKRLKN